MIGLRTVHHREVSDKFANGKPRARPKVEEWDETVTIIGITTTPQGTIVVVAGAGGRLREVALRDIRLIK